MKSPGYQPRTYQSICRHGSLVNFRVAVRESDLFIRAQADLSGPAAEKLKELRSDLDRHIGDNREFRTSLAPVMILEGSPEIVRDMAHAAARVGVGPMAAVAGAIAERVARHLARVSKEVVVENGGDIFIISEEPMIVAIYAGASPLSMKLGVELPPAPQGLSICTSSGTVGHSLSFGKADAIVVVAKSGSLADAAATAFGNMVKTAEDIGSALDRARQQKGILGAVIIVGEKIGFFGDVVKLVELGPGDGPGGQAEK